MPFRANYPQRPEDVLDPPVRFKRRTVAAVARFKMSKPWRGTEEERKAKFERLHLDLCAVYGKQTRLTFGLLDGGDSGSSHYTPSTDTITLCGRISVLTLLHEFAHALGKDERGACRWSLNLFRRVFPVSFSRCTADGHTLRSARSEGSADRTDRPDPASQGERE
jgi:hypothetical protein